MIRVVLGEVVKEKLAKAFCWGESGVVGVDGLYMAENIGG